MTLKKTKLIAVGGLKKAKLIAVGGLKNSGKNEASKMLQYCLNAPMCLQHYWCFKLFNKMVPKKYSVTSFAHSLKKTLAALLNVPIEKFENRDFKENTYIYFPTLRLFKKSEVIQSNTCDDWFLSDNKFNKFLAAKDYSFLTKKAITVRQLLQCFGTEIMRGFFGNNLWILATLKNSSNVIVSDLRFKVEADAVKKEGGTMIFIKRSSCVPGNHASEKKIMDLYKHNQFDYVVCNDGSLKDLFNNIKRICG